MRLHSPTSAILSAVIFNALIIVALIPLALKGVKYRAEAAHRLVAKPNDIWSWRSDRTVYRYQTDRPGVVGIFVGEFAGAARETGAGDVST
jgi:hypothetical protein